MQTVTDLFPVRVGRYGMSEQPESTERFAAWIRETMRRRVWTQAEFARKTKVSSSVVSRWLNGQQPDPASVRKIASRLGEDLNSLMAMAGYLEIEKLALPPQKAALVAKIVQTELTPAVMSMMDAVIEHERRNPQER